MNFTSGLIVAAGTGTRMGPDVDKLFLEVAGKPVIAHTWSIFERCTAIDEIILVVRASMRVEFEKIADCYGYTKPVRYAIGGAERQNSVWNGLKEVSAQADVVAIQDGARPCTTEILISECVKQARKMGASVAAQRVTDTLKEANDQGFIRRNVDRSRIWAVQTPQTFRVEIIRKALAEVMKQGLIVTDDTAACELIHQPVKLVETRTANPKVTTPADLPLIEILLRSC